MSIFLILLLVAAMIATVVALVRGIVIFLKTNHENIARGGDVSASGMRQNKMMQARIMFQAIAILIVILLLVLGGHGASGGQ
ncbi:MAG: twin transmembrane helix small protein [Sphingomonadaceae bacterium]|nr:twin transmembrane helix small protein [Sphingomonadaceae bacterium]